MRKNKRQTRPAMRHIGSMAAVVTLLSVVQTAMAVSPFIVKNIKVEGLRRVEPGTVFGYMPVRIGDTIDNTKASQTVDALYRTGFFQDVRIEAESDTLVVRVIERPTIGAFKLEGVEDLGREEIKRSLKNVGITEGRFYDKALANRAEQELKRMYLSRGYYASQIKATVTPIDQDRVSFVLNVQEGPKAKIRKINFTGNKQFTEGQLRSEMMLSTPGWLSWYTKDDLYSKDAFAADLEALRSFYLNRGFLDFDIESTKVGISPDKKDIYLTINLHEGVPYKISDVTLSGETLNKEAELKEKITLKSGELFSSQKLGETSKAITNVLGRYGYAFATVEPIPSVNPSKQEVALDLKIVPGKRIYVRKINIVGNEKTRDEVIRRELRQMESAWFDGEKLALSKARVARTGYFEDVKVTTDSVAGSNDQVDITFSVKEKPTGLFNIGVGYSTTDKIVFQTSINQDNVFGSGTNIGLEVNTSKTNRTLSVQHTDPYFTIDGISRLTNVYYRTSTPYSNSTNESAEYKFVSTGGSMRFGVPFSESDVVYFGLGVEHVNLKNPEFGGYYVNKHVSSFGKASTSFPFTIGWARDSRDSALVPTEGTLQQASIEVAAPIGRVRYGRAEYQITHYIPFLKGFTLALNGAATYGKGYSGKPYPIFKNQTSGGIGSVRGFGTNSLGPREIYCTSAQNCQLVTPGGPNRINFNAEVYAPIPGAKLDKTFRFFGFVDVGNVFQEGQFYKPSEFRASAGLGISWNSPIGPLKFSYALPIRKKVGDELQKFQFQVGTSF